MKEINFSSYKSPFLSRESGNSHVSGSCWTHLSCQRTSPLFDIEHRQHGKGPVGVLGEAAITYLGKSPKALEREKRMLNLGTNTGLAPVGGFVGLGQRSVLVGPLVGKVFGLRRQFPEEFVGL